MEKTFVIETNAISSNIKIIKETVSDAIIYAVLKGNAYGMGLFPFAHELYKNSISHFAVTDLSDAVSLKSEFPDCEVLLLTPCEIKEDILLAVNAKLTLTVDSIDNASTISKISEELNTVTAIQIKIDTGMGRYGFLPSQIDEIVASTRLKNIDAQGIYTHLHSAFNKKAEISYKQFEIFKNVIAELEKQDVVFTIKHICNSTAIFRFKDMHLTAVRAGSALIGRVNSVCGKTNLYKIGKLYSKVCDIRELPKGHNIGYAALYKTKKQTKIACTNVGYADGIAVCKANDTFRFIDILRYCYNNLKLIIKPTRLACKIKGKTAFSVGRIGMTNLVLDVTKIDDIKIGDEICIDANPIYLSPLIKREYR